MLTSNQRDIVAMILTLNPTIDKEAVIEQFEMVRKNLENEETKDESNISN